MRKLTKTAAIVASMAVMAMGATVITSAAQEGWVQSGSNWYYYINGNAIENQWMQAGDKWYFLGEDGKMVTNAFVQDGEEVDRDTDELDPANDDDAIYYVDSDGAMVTGWKRIDINSTGSFSTPTPRTSNKWYYFGGSGEMFGERWVQSGDKWYYLGTDGIMVTNDWSNEDSEDNYYLNGDGEWVTGWYKVTDDDDKLEADDGEWVYLDEDGDVAENGWMRIDSNWYYFGAASKSAMNTTDYSMGDEKDAQMLSETFIRVQRTNSSSTDDYYLKSNGSLATGWFTVRDEGADGRPRNQYYANGSGVIQKNKVQTVSSRHYYLDENGVNQSDNYSYAYVYKNGTSDVTVPINVTTLQAVKDAIDANENIATGTRVTIYRLKNSSSYTYTAK